MAIISKLEAKEILDSRGNPTVQASCRLQDGTIEIASVPSGVSTGKYEAFELRDNDMNRYRGKGVERAVGNINGEISEFLVGKELDQNTLDEALINLDGTKNKQRLGANAILAVSLAFARASAKEKGIPLFKYLANIYFKNENERMYKIPQPVFNTIEGGKHSDSGLSFQEFLLVPQEFENIKIKLEVIKKIFISLKDLLVKDGYEVNLGDEGGFSPKLSSDEKVLEYFNMAISSAGYNADQVKIGLDVAATTFFKDGLYLIKENKLNTREMIEMYKKLCEQYKIISIEDGLNEEDFAGFAEMNKALGQMINIVGDDITVTNIDLIKNAINNKSINTLLIKPNQIGTLSETMQAIRLAKENNIKTFISHRGGETEDTFVADLAVAVGADFIKAGGPTKPERIVKYHRLIEIEELIK
ncbi:MAG: phosphopyruvate hydratase [Patescibacteria group bacterium]|nr:phosphopyruvate hydratase [Patescibacteria group bacterium]